MAKVEHHIEDCIGCGACAGACPDFWELDEVQGKSHLKGSKKEGSIFVLEADDIGCNSKAASICPVQCIKIIE